MSKFTGVAEYGVQQILQADTNNRAIEIAQNTFPGIPEHVVLEIRRDPSCVSFTPDGNTLQVNIEHGD